MLIAQIPKIGQIRCIFDDNYGIFLNNSQSGDSNEHHKLIFYGELTNHVFLVIINVHTFSDLLISSEN